MAAGTASLNDMYVLSQCVPYQNRVQAGLLLACVLISNEGPVANHSQRKSLCTQILESPVSWTLLFSNSCATDATSIAVATVAATNYVALTTANVAAQQALITDTQISNAIASQFNSYIENI